MSSSRFNVDAVGIFWACFAATWTVCILAGITFLLIKRDCQLLRIRGIPLSVCAVTLLHCYWLSVQLGYIVLDAMPGDAQYWIMGTWLPLGIALFHASNSRFLHVAKGQRRFMKQEYDDSLEKQQISTGRRRKETGVLYRFRRMDHTAKVFTLVGAGMVIQIFVTIIVYLMSRKWHSTWGIPGTEVRGDTEQERKVNMTKGWEWAHSVFWQFFWAWIVAPFILWQSRGIHDTQGWRVQTIGCCIASLHATPMWLVALYVPAMEQVNKYFIPPQWVALSIMVLEVFTIFLPCWQVLRHQTLQQETLDSIAQWEAKNQLPADGVGRAKSIASSSTLVESVGASGWRYSSNSESVLTMGALEHVLERNPGPLLEFSALRDFSGENIAFLTAVARWKTPLTPAMLRTSRGKSVSFAMEKIETGADQDAARELTRERFNLALKIYVDFVSSRRAAFQVNLPSPILKHLESVFETPAQELFGDGRSADPVTPFATPDSWTFPNMSEDGSEKYMVAARESTPPPSAPPPSAPVHDGARIRYSGVLPEGFKDDIFDEAEASVKYLVLTNTWPKFVKERRSSMDSANVV